MYPAFVKCSPRGLVPAVHVEGDGGDERVWDSAAVVEYIDEKWSSSAPLLPSDPLERARCKIFVAHCADHVQKHFYTCLMEQEPGRKSAARQKTIDGMRTLARAMDLEGPFFLGANFSYFEVCVAPFWQRYLWVGEKYCALKLPEDEDFRRLDRWWSATCAHSSVVRPPREEH